MSLLEDFQREQGLLTNTSSSGSRAPPPPSSSSAAASASSSSATSSSAAAATSKGQGQQQQQQPPTGAKKGVAPPSRSSATRGGGGGGGSAAGGSSGGGGGGGSSARLDPNASLLTGYVAVAALERERPIFSLEAVRYAFQGGLLDLAVANNTIILALDTNHVQRIDLANASDIEDVEISSKVQDRIHKIFLDPTARHLLISMENGDNYYLGFAASSASATPTSGGGGKAKKPKALKSLKGHVIESVAWNKIGPHDVTTKEFLLGTTKGALLEIEIDPVDEFLKKDVRTLKQVFQLQENTPVTGLRFELFPASSKKYFIVATNPTRIYQFVGNAGAPGSSFFEGVFTNYKTNAGYSELPGGDEESHVDFFSQYQGLIKSFAWLTGVGIYNGNFVFGSQSAGDSVIDNPTLVPYPALTGNPGAGPKGSRIKMDGNDDDKRPGPMPLSIAITEFHFVLLYPDRLCAVNRLNDKLVFEELFPKQHVPFKRVEVDRSHNTFWAYSASSIFEIVITKESRDVWNIYLDLGQFNTALQYCENAVQKDRVYTAQADHYFDQQKYKLAAAYYAQTGKPFEEITLLFIRRQEREALKTYLQRKIENLRHQDWTQLTIISTWLVEIYLNQMNDLKDANNEEGFHEIQEEFHQFLASANVKERLNKNVTYNLISSHGRVEEMIFFATLMEDYERVIAHYIQLGDYKQALTTLSKQSSMDLYYKFSPILMEKAPHDTVSCWIHEPNLNPQLLIPALLKYDPQANPETVQQNQAIRYLQYCVDKYDIKDPTIHDFLLSLYVQQADDVALMAFIGTEAKQSHFDLQYALRLCTQHGKTQARILISSALGLYEEAVELALQLKDLELAKINADKPEDDDAMRKKLWLRIARYVVEEEKGEKSIKKAMAFLKECDLLKIEDVLPFFPDFVLIDDFKDEICAALEEYNRHIEDLKLDMNEATRSAESIRLDIQDLRHKYGFVGANEKCYLCHFPLFTRQFYLFSCQHVFHQNCLTAELMKHMSNSSRAKVAKCMEQIAKEAAAEQSAPKKADDAQTGASPLQQAKAALDELIASECPLCGDAMIKSIEKPFINENELEIIRSWEL